MGKIIDSNKKVMLGQILRVENTEKKLHENQKYIAVQVQDQNGSNERCLLFTEIQASDLEKIVFDFAKQRMINGRLYKAIINGTETYLCKMVGYNDNVFIARISKTQLAFAEQRANRNPEDLTKKGFLTNLMD